MLALIALRMAVAAVVRLVALLVATVVSAELSSATMLASGLVMRICWIVGAPLSPAVSVILPLDFTPATAGDEKM